LPNLLHAGGEVFPNLLFGARGDLRIGDDLDRQVWCEPDGDIVTVQVPLSIFLDFGSKVCHFSLDECESRSARKQEACKSESARAPASAQPRRTAAASEAAAA
jgi:hypothetical protein